MQQAPGGGNGALADRAGPRRALRRAGYGRAVDVLEEQPALRRPATARALHELVAHERARQDARMAALRRLRGDAEALLVTPGGDGVTRRGLVARLGARLRPKRGPPVTEAVLRARYEEAELRARRAAVFAEALAALEVELAEELLRLDAVLAELAEDEKTIDELRARVRAAAADAELAHDAARAAPSLGAEAPGGDGDPARARALEARIEQARIRADALEAQRASIRDAEDRLLGLVEAEKMLGARLAHLRREVERAAGAAARRLDGVADALRSLVTTSDAERVMGELEDALTTLFGSIEASARLARDAQEAADDRERRGRAGGRR
jgi:hypothetical protein